MPDSRYYLAYENRYQAVFGAGATHWGFAADNPWLSETLAAWVDEKHLRGKCILEFACGEGACGVILSRLGCIWTGIDIAPTAVEKAREAVREFPGASVIHADCTEFSASVPFDAALDVMGLHMLVTDSDRAKYLGALSSALKSGAPALFLRESFREDAYTGKVESFADWERISDSDYHTPEPRTVQTVSGKAEVMLPLLPARARNRAGYAADLTVAGLTLERFSPDAPNAQIPYSASFYARKI